MNDEDQNEAKLDVGANAAMGLAGAIGKLLQPHHPAVAITAVVISAALTGVAAQMDKEQLKSVFNDTADEMYKAMKV